MGFVQPLNGMPACGMKFSTHTCASSDTWTLSNHTRFFPTSFFFPRNPCGCFVPISAPPSSRLCLGELAFRLHFSCTFPPFSHRPAHLQRILMNSETDFTDLKVRSRTQEFLERRNALQSSTGLPSARSSEVTATILPPWVRSLEQFFDLESKVTARQEKLVESQRAFLRPRFGTDDEEEERLHAVVEKQANEIRKLLKELERMVLTGMRPGDMANEEEVLIAHNAQRCLSTELKSAIKSFKQAQEFFGGQLKRREMKAQKFMNIADDEEAVQLVAREEKTSQFLALGYTEADVEGLLLEDAQQQETNKEIKEILASIQELHTMFEDLSILVVDQGTILDRIDFNIQQASQHVSKGLGELKKAQEHQSTCFIM